MTVASPAVESIAVGVHGRLHENSWPRNTSTNPDCFSVFNSMSASLGFTSTKPPGPSQWEMNDAGGPWPGDDPAELRGWFQVAAHPDTDEPLPVEALTFAAVNSVERFGRLTLFGLEFYLPLWCSGPANVRLLDGQAWFGAADPAARTRILLTLDSGTSDVVVERSGDILDAIDALGSRGAGFEFARAEGAAAVEFSSPVPWRWWLGENGTHTTSMSVVVPERSSFALGRAVAYVAEACRFVSISTAVAVRIAGSAEPSS